MTIIYLTGKVPLLISVENKKKIGKRNEVKRPNVRNKCKRKVMLKEYIFVEWSEFVWFSTGMNGWFFKTEKNFWFPQKNQGVSTTSGTS